MTLVLLSDLHIKSGDTPNDILWLNHFCEWVRCNSGEKIIICIMGDIIHCGNEAAFDAADNIFDDLKNIFLYHTMMMSTESIDGHYKNVWMRLQHQQPSAA